MAETDPNPALYYTVEQAAEILYVSQRTIRTYISSGRLPARRWGRRLLIPRAAVDGDDDTGDSGAEAASH